MKDQPLFKSTQDALVFALAFGGQQYDRSAMARLMAGPVGNGKGLSGTDGAAQAGSIRRKLMELGPLHEAIMVARYAPRQTPCTRCGTPCASDDWKEALAVIQEAAATAALSGLMSHRRLRVVIVARAFGATDSLTEVAEACDVHRNTVSKHNGLIHAWLQGAPGKDGGAATVGEEERAFAAIDDVLTSSGLVCSALAA